MYLVSDFKRIGNLRICTIFKFLINYGLHDYNKKIVLAFCSTCLGMLMIIITFQIKGACSANLE